MDAGIPTLETPRLRLRAFREADVEPLFDLLQDPGVVRYIGDRRGDAPWESLRGETELRGHRVLVYGISRGEWNAAGGPGQRAP